ncbi:MAG: alpha/beta hydrolase [Gammaproteobacteria bacterium]|nr:MAG: alpha/beta hydrolase [Gammaproteobacteria bacterium]RLA57170.1 MAG: alpha/beta hydrolase [Gammaproteobacteria bacterium]HDY83967.1 alpha/beta fold hydrolase [Halieaceae bacterium]
MQKSSSKYSLVLVLLFLAALSACSGFFFFPSRDIVQTPDQIGLDYKNIQLSTADSADLHAWFLPVKGEPKASILFLHGNAENISTHINNVYWLPAMGYQVLLLDYRGYGNSSGSPSLPAVFMDIDAGMSWLTEASEASGQGLYILGQSMGASLMLHAASHYTGNARLCGLISDAAFTRYGDIVQHTTSQSWVTWPLQYPLSLVVGRAYDPIDAMARLYKLPILFFHSTDDPIIPFAYMDELIAMHPGPSQRVATSGPHTATFNQGQNREILLGFLARYSSLGTCNPAR